MLFTFLNGWEKTAKEDYFVIGDNDVKFKFQSSDKVLLEHSPAQLVTTLPGGSGPVPAPGTFWHPWRSAVLPSPALLGTSRSCHGLLLHICLALLSLPLLCDAPGGSQVCSFRDSSAAPPPPRPDSCLAGSTTSVCVSGGCCRKVPLPRGGGGGQHTSQGARGWKSKVKMLAESCPMRAQFMDGHLLAVSSHGGRDGEHLGSLFQGQ